MVCSRRQVTPRAVGSTPAGGVGVVATVLPPSGRRCDRRSGRAFAPTPAQQRDQRGLPSTTSISMAEPARALPDPPTAGPHTRNLRQMRQHHRGTDRRRTDRQRISLQASAMGQWVGTAAGLAAADPPQRKAWRRAGRRRLSPRRIGRRRRTCALPAGYQSRTTWLGCSWLCAGRSGVSALDVGVRGLSRAARATARRVTGSHTVAAAWATARRA